MRKLNRYEYEIAVAILASHLSKEKVYSELEEITSMDWTCASFSRQDEKLFESLLRFLEIPAELRGKDGHIIYCRDWIWDIYFNDIKLDQNDTQIPDMAKLFLDRIISGHLEWEAKLATTT